MQLAFEEKGAVTVVRVQEAKLTYPVFSAFFSRVRQRVEDGARRVVIDLLWRQILVFQGTVSLHLTATGIRRAKSKVCHSGRGAVHFDIIKRMIGPFITGFANTFKHMFRKPITVNYPDQKVQVFPRYRGKHVLMRDENGVEKCVACGLCAVACPADAIYLEPAENDGTVQAGPRYADLYQIHKTRCIFCGYCEEACPEDAIFLGHNYELSDYTRDSFVYAKEQLLVPV